MAEKDTGEILSLSIEVTSDDAQKKLKEYTNYLKQVADKSDEYNKKLKSLWGFAARSLALAKKSGNQKEIEAYDKLLKQVNKLKYGYATLNREKENIDIKDQIQDPNLDDLKTDDWVKKIVKGQSIVTKFFETIENGIKKITKETEYDEGVKSITTTYKKMKGEIVSEIKGTPKIDLFSDGNVYRTTVEVTDKVKTIRKYVIDTNGQISLLSKKVEHLDEKGKFNWAKKMFDGISDRASKGLKKFARNNIFKKIGSIITYRFTRTLLSSIKNSIKKGFELLSEQDLGAKSVKEQFNTIATSFQISIATLLLPALQTLSNILQPVSSQFIEMANAVSLATAENGKYFKISKEKVDAYAKSLSNTSAQLSQLDKFATLSGAKQIDIGEMVDVNEATDIEQANIEKYQKVIDLVKKLSEWVENLADWFSKLNLSGTDTFKGIAAAAGLLLAAINPLAGLFVGIIAMMASTSSSAKILSGVIITLATTMIALGVAKTFAGNAGLGLKGALIAVAAGALVGTVISGLLGSVDTGSSSAKVPSSFSSVASVGESSFTQGTDVGNALSAYTSRTATAQSATVQGDVYLDGSKVGKIITPQVYSAGVKAGYFGVKR